MRLGENQNDERNRAQLADEQEFHRRKTGEFLEESGCSIPCQYIPPPPEPTDEWLMDFVRNIKEISALTCKIRKDMNL